VLLWEIEIHRSNQEQFFIFAEHNNNNKLVPRGLSGVNEIDKGVFLPPPPRKGKFLGEAEKTTTSK
jgi:hypothetical protein